MPQPPKRYAPCPCDSKQLYHKCCKPYHDGVSPAPTAEALMRSRYCAYALGLVDYVLSTTHPENPSYTTDLPTWRRSAVRFSEAMTFVALEVLSADPADEAPAAADRAYVTFTATLREGSRDASFTERSTFLRQDGRWLYHSGEFLD